MATAATPNAIAATVRKRHGVGSAGGAAASARRRRAAIAASSRRRHATASPCRAPLAATSATANAAKPA